MGELAMSHAKLELLVDLAMGAGSATGFREVECAAECLVESAAECLVAILAQAARAGLVALGKVDTPRRFRACIVQRPSARSKHSEWRILRKATMSLVPIAAGNKCGRPCCSRLRS